MPVARTMAFNRPVTRWSAIVPIRSLQEGKSRLAGFADQAAVTEAFARDVLAACASCPHIESTIVVSADPAVLELAGDVGARPHHQKPPAGINEAIAQVRADLPATTAVVAILGDTPCLTGEVLTAVLTAAQTREVSFVSDTAGTGTTIWCSRTSDAVPHFGAHSRAHHRAAGADELGGLDGLDAGAVWNRARRDVDTEIDLWDAGRLGVGPATSRLLAHNEHGGSPRRAIPDVQSTNGER